MGTGPVLYQWEARASKGTRQVQEGFKEHEDKSVRVCGEDVEILESFTYLGSVVHNDGGS